MVIFRRQLVWRDSIDGHLGADEKAQHRSPNLQGSGCIRGLYFITYIFEVIVSFPELKNDVFLRALMREPVPYTHVWLMRQAGRYLPEYRATRAEAGSFLNLAQNKEYACEVTLQPLLRFDFDAAILFSHILTRHRARVRGLDFIQGAGPKFAHPIRNEDDVAKLTVPDMEKLRYAFDAVNLIRHELDGKVPLIGFAGSPWTIGCYMVEGAGC